MIERHIAAIGNSFVAIYSRNTIMEFMSRGLFVCLFCAILSAVTDGATTPSTTTTSTTTTRAPATTPHITAAPSVTPRPGPTPSSSGGGGGVGVGGGRGGSGNSVISNCGMGCINRAPISANSLGMGYAGSSAVTSLGLWSIMTIVATITYV
ncbi:dachshund homolog 1-like [Saccostrea cucullata]|uniref:dachshund homolog 1-like n=1 Tax=Saccostrea cuccullata TaxID=36930 RepID=UPI002ED02A54